MDSKDPNFEYLEAEISRVLRILLAAKKPSFVESARLRCNAVINTKTHFAMMTIEVVQRDMNDKMHICNHSSMCLQKALVEMDERAKAGDMAAANEIAKQACVEIREACETFVESAVSSMRFVHQIGGL